MSETDISTELGTRLAEFLGVEEKDTPKFMMIKFVGEDLKKFPMSTSLSVENIVEFVE